VRIQQTHEQEDPTVAHEGESATLDEAVEVAEGEATRTPLALVKVLAARPEPATPPTPTPPHPEPVDDTRAPRARRRYE
jgi:hypothetical protein